MAKNVGSRNWAWEYFERDGTKYRDNKTHWNAWCSGCLRFESESLREKDEQLVLYGQIEKIRSDDELHEQGIPICGKITTLHTHLARCTHANPQARRRASLDRARPLRKDVSAPVPTNDTPNAPTSSVGQEWFDTALCRVAASAGWAWNSINDPEFVSMMRVLRPDLTVTDRRALSGRVLDEEIARVVDNLKIKVKGKLATGMCDGWKNVTKTSVIAMMATVDYEAHFIHSIDVSADRKTADHLLSLVLEEIQYLEGVLELVVAGYCTDASSECRSMRNKLKTLRPYLITLDCYAHQINLVVGDIFKQVPTMAEVAERANKIVKWFRNHSYSLGLLQKCQQEEYGAALALVIPVITRWTAHYCSAARLLDTVKALQVCVVRYEEEMLDSTGLANSEARKTSQEVLNIIKDPTFWCDLTTMKITLEPLAIAANITQAGDTRLDHVLIAMCSLYHAYSQKSDIPEATRATVHNSLEKRWKKSDQPPFIAAVYFNPFYRHHLFNPDEPGLRPLGLYTILKHLFTRVFPNEEFLAGSFMEANASYAASTGCFSDEHMYLQELQDQSIIEGKCLTLLHVWENLALGPQSGVQQFARLAHRILSLVPTTAGCERLFSQMGITHTKLRNRLTTSSARKIVQLKMDLRARQAREGLLKPRSGFKLPLHTPSQPTEAHVEHEDDEDDRETDGEVDVRTVIDGLVADVDADDGVDESEGEVDQDNGGAAEHTGERVLPRIVFHWSRELTLARLFDYESLSAARQAWSRATSTWVGGAANLKDEMAHYGLDDIFEKEIEGTAG